MDQRAADIILGVSDPGDRFTIKWCGISFRLQIKLLTTEQLIKVSKEICKIHDIDDQDETMFQSLMQHVDDERHICKAIAISTGTPFVKIVSRAILKLPLRDIQTLFNIVKKQSDPNAFFFTISSAKKLSLLKSKKDAS
jgi:hypothetical protein